MALIILLDLVIMSRELLRVGGKRIVEVSKGVFGIQIEFHYRITKGFWLWKTEEEQICWKDYGYEWDPKLVRYMRGYGGERGYWTNGGDAWKNFDSIEGAKEYLEDCKISYPMVVFDLAQSPVEIRLPLHPEERNAL